jgi:NitT/TauT family transport system substrate-binding protein
MRSGELDCADFGTTGAFSQIAQGADDLKIFGGQIHEGSGIICLPENEEKFSDFSNYKGATIGLVPMSTGDVVYRYGLAQAGLDLEKDVTIVELDSAATVIEAVKKVKSIVVEFGFLTWQMPLLRDCLLPCFPEK